MKRYSRASLVATAACSASAALHAQPPSSSASSGVDEVVVTGTRFEGRLAAESPVPVDSIGGEELREGGYTGLHQMLKVQVPSFSLPHPSTAGTLDFTSVPTLRGLSPGQLLLLVNGKRRHSTGDLGNGVQIGRGDVAYDFNAIPTAAIGHVEVLRDGAAAQYGADAIAGVINVVLDRSLGAGADASYGRMSAGDGRALDVNAYAGVPLGEDGIVRATFAYQDHGLTDRSVADTRQQYFGSNGAEAASGNFGSGIGLTPPNGTLDPRESTIDRHTFRYGDGPYESKAVFVNFDKPLNATTRVYAFGGYSRLDGDSFGFWRRAAQDQTVRALYPDGYLPITEVEMDNASAAAGVRGEDLAGFAWDVSTVYGTSIIDNVQSNSNNPSLGPDSPTRSYRGGTRFSQWTSNLDLTRDFPAGGDRPLQLALGLEHREEWYRIVEGDVVSYENGGVPIIGGPNAGSPAPVGFQVTSGNRPSDVVDVSRHSNSLYAELQKELTSRLLLSGSGRFEDYSDFGSNTTFKLAGRFEIVEPLALRASISTGLRSPNLAQSYFSSTATNFINSVPVLTRILPVSDPSARLLGSSDLRPETSRNASLGLVFNRGPLLLSADFYRIRIDDRIALSSMFQDPRITDLLAAHGNPGIGAVSYLTNAVDTTTDGADLTATFAHDWNGGSTLNATFGANFNRTRFDRISPTPAPLLALGITTPLFDLTQQIRFTDSQPRDKYVLRLAWTRGNWSANLNNTRYGEVATVAFTNLSPAEIAAVTPGYKVRLEPTDPPGPNSQVVQVFEPRTISDLEVTYRANEHFVLSLGAQNLFDVYPSKNIRSTAASVAAGTNGADNAGIFPYNYVSPFGWNGRFVYFKTAYTFRPPS